MKQEDIDKAIAEIEAVSREQERKRTCTHCWHDTGLAYACHPPEYCQVCCHCGFNRTVSEPSASREGHGSYMP